MADLIVFEGEDHAEGAEAVALVFDEALNRFNFLVQPQTLCRQREMGIGRTGQGRVAWEWQGLLGAVWHGSLLVDGWDLRE
jgi:hypothetical protein